MYEEKLRASVPFGASIVTKRMETHVSKLLVLKGSMLEVTTLVKSPKKNHEQHHVQSRAEAMKGKERPDPIRRPQLSTLLTGGIGK